MRRNKGNNDWTGALLKDVISVQAGLVMKSLTLTSSAAGMGFAGMRRQCAQVEAMREHIDTAFVGHAPIVATQRQKIPTVDILQAQRAGDLQRGERAGDMRARTDGAMHANILALNQGGEFTEVTGFEGDVGFEPDRTGGGLRCDEPVQRATHGTEAVAGAIGTRG